ncbi:MAG TPA: hypothetical protein VF503_00135 [Sphingobium sp.]
MSRLETIATVVMIASTIFIIVGWHIENVRKGFRDIDAAIKTQSELDG